ncbi:MAG: YbfB/YjiJ family MFS transporter [Pseudomonadota bacterium]
MRIALAGLAALAVAMGIGRFAFTPILPMMQQDAGLSVAGGGWLASANYLGYLAGALWAGATRANAATAIRAGLAAIGVATLAMALDAGFAAWAVLRVIAGVASAWVLIHTSAWCLERLAPRGLERSAPPARPILAGVLFAGVGVGIIAAGSLCVILMAARAGSAIAWLVLGIVSLATTVAVWSIFDFSNEKEKTFNDPHRWTWEQARLVLAYGAYGFGYIIPATFLPVMAREVVSDPAVFGWAWPVFGAAAALSTLGVALLSGRYGNRAAWIGSQLAMALGVAAPVFWPGIGGIVLAALCVGGTFVVITMVGLQEARTVAGPQAARLMAAMTAAFAAGQIAGPLSVSLMVSAGGGFSAALLIASGVLVAGSGALLVTSSRSPRSRSRSC